VSVFGRLNTGSGKVILKDAVCICSLKKAGIFGQKDMLKLRHWVLLSKKEPNVETDFCLKQNKTKKPL
jgi:hypothetical protein